MRNWFLALGLLPALVSVALADEAILVFDASGSMWGQVEGKTKAEIARTPIKVLAATATLNAPAAPGSYELRYSLNGKKVIARKAIAVTAP